MSSGLIPQNFVEDLISRIDLASLISERVNLKKSGATYQGCCPFHDEKTPSFHVYNEANPAHYHCYGCGAHGDAIDFLKNLDHMSFNESVESLARRYGLEIPRDPAAQQAVNRFKPLYEASQLAAEAYQGALRKHPNRETAVSYLKNRGLSREMIELYGIGFAPPERSFLQDNSTPNDHKHLREIRLVGEKDGRRYELFQNRLMFPIRDTRGRVVAFGGRTLGQDRSKYINSPENPIFHKSKQLYGLWEARKQAKQLEQLIVVEGYLDVISLSQFGITNAVAAMGTATNEENLSHLLSTCPDIVFCFDGDKAGLNAADKALRNLLPMFRDGYKVSFLILPEGEDPDTLVRQEGGEAFAERIKQAAPLSEYFFTSLSRDLNLSVAEDKGVLNQVARDALQDIQAPILKDALFSRLRELTRSPKWQDRKKGEWRNFKSKFQPEVVEEPLPVPNRTTARICLGLYYDPSWAEQIAGEVDLELLDKDMTPMKLFLQWILDNKISSQQELLYKMATDSRSRQRFKNLFGALEHIFSAEELQTEARDSFNTLKRKYFDLTFEKLQLALRQNPSDRTLLMQLQALTKEKHSMTVRKKK
ncbi:DNA primase [Hahella sp. CCB-MM4]|uniref:DNA primase n=1 Tax=Hahella sp. (strain CCB-MM4) TaxID=1926491 RepID=UPI000B9B5382|nr:DNA primase [Hahella sp. CCB-MM4]OZG70064.1 DNA primase [Hahella sp. CCB-MM4]